VGRATLEAGQWLGVLDEAARLEVEHGPPVAIYELTSGRPLQGALRKITNQSGAAHLAAIVININKLYVEQKSRSSTGCTSINVHNDAQAGLSDFYRSRRWDKMSGPARAELVSWSCSLAPGPLIATELRSILWIR